MIYLIVIALFIYVIHRINTLERKIIEIKKPTASAAPIVPTPASYQRTEQPIRVAEQPAATFGKPASAPASMPAMQSTPVHIASVPAQKSQANSDTEFNLGSKVFTAVGVIAVLLGVGFFLRYAFANNLISQGTRVFMGCIFGLVLVGIGHYLRKKYLTYGLTLVGAGFGVFYLSIYAAYNFYHLLDPVTAFVVLFLITAVSVALAIWYDSKPLIGCSFAGAFIMPFLLPFSGTVHTLFIYLLIINAGALLVARFKVWPLLTVGSLGGTSLIYLDWIFGPYTDSLFWPTLIYGSLIFLSYFTTSLLNFIYRDRNYEGVDGLLLYATPITYFVLNSCIMHTQDNLALLAFFIGLFNLAVFCVVRFGFASIGELKKFSEGILLMASVFVAGGLGLHFNGSSLTIIWAMLASVMVSVGSLIRSKVNSFVGCCLAVLVGLKVIVAGFILPLGAVAIFNGRSGTLCVVAFMFAIIWTVYRIEQTMSEKGEDSIYTKDQAIVGKNLGMIGVFGTIFLWINLESYSFLKDFSLYLPLWWTIYALVMVSISFFFQEKVLRYLSYLIMFLGFIFMLFGQWMLDPATHALFFNIRMLTAVVYVAAVALIIQLIKMNPTQVTEEDKSMRGIFLLLANLAFLWATTLEVLGYFNQQMAGRSSQAIVSIENTKRVSLSVFWLLYALAGLAVGIFKRSLFARYFSIFLFGITIFKIFIYDTANLSDVYRFVSFIVLGVILLIVGFSYYRFKDRIAEFVTGAK